MSPPPRLQQGGECPGGYQDAARGCGCDAQHRRCPMSPPPSLQTGRRVSWGVSGRGERIRKRRSASQCFEGHAAEGHARAPSVRDSPGRGENSHTQRKTRACPSTPVSAPRAHRANCGRRTGNARRGNGDEPGERKAAKTSVGPQGHTMGRSRQRPDRGGSGSHPFYWCARWTANRWRCSWRSRSS